MSDPRKILFFGDSHVHAVRDAIKQGATGPDGHELRALRLTKIKHGALIGNISHSDLVLVCNTLSAGDLAVSVVGGNQHATLSLIRHPSPFDMMAPEATAPDVPQIVPRNAIKGLFRLGMQPNDIRRIAEAAAAGPHRTVHLAPPPPKADEAHILRRVEADFAARGIMEHGVSPAPLRLRFWEVQVEVLTEMLAEHGVTVLPPPDGTRTEDGYLRPEYYARDATHANPAYGARVLDQIAALVKTPAPV